MWELKDALYEELFKIVIESLEQKHGVMDDEEFHEHCIILFYALGFFDEDKHEKIASFIRTLEDIEPDFLINTDPTTWVTMRTNIDVAWV